MRDRSSAQVEAKREKPMSRPRRGSLQSAKVLITGALFWGAAVGGEAAAPEALLVVPRRLATVQTALDFLRLREMAIVVYDVSQSVDSPRLYQWNAKTLGWDPVDFRAYRAGHALRPPPPYAFVVGDRPAEVDVMTRATAWCREVIRIPSLRVDDLANALHDRLRFTEREWTMLRARQGLQVEDLAAKERKYGRYGPARVRPGPPPDLDRNPLVQWCRRKEAEALSRQGVERGRGPEEPVLMPEVEPLAPTAPVARPPSFPAPSVPPSPPDMVPAEIRPAVPAPADK